MNSWYAGSKPADDFEDNMNKAMSVQGFLLYRYPKEKQRKKKEETCKTTSKLELSKNERDFKGCQKFRQEALNGKDFSPGQFCKIPLDTLPPFQNYIS